MYRILSYLYPKKIREAYIRLLVYANIKTDPLIFLGFNIFSAAGLSLAISFVLAPLLNTSIYIVLIISFAVIQATIYFYFTLKVDARAKAVELILPDALQLMASNLRAGLTTDRALLLAARPEFGTFKDDLNEVGKEISVGIDITVALTNLTKKIKSEVLEKTIVLIVSGINSGGELASLLEQVSKNLRQQNLVHQKVKSGVLMYVIFIFVAIGIGSPILFGLSSYLVNVLSTQFAALAQVELPASIASPFDISGLVLTEGFIIRYSLVSLVTSSVMGSFVLGLISKGKESGGVKYIPVFLVLTFSLFFLMRFIMKTALSGLFGL